MLEHIRAGSDLATAAAQARLSPATVRGWYLESASGPTPPPPGLCVSFRLDVDEAVATKTATLLSRLEHTGTTGTARSKKPKCEDCGKRTELFVQDPRALEAVLRLQDPDRFGGTTHARDAVAMFRGALQEELGRHLSIQTRELQLSDEQWAVVDNCMSWTLANLPA